MSLQMQPGKNRETAGQDQLWHMPSVTCKLNDFVEQVNEPGEQFVDPGNKAGGPGEIY
jgi:hypothetical protein